MRFARYVLIQIVAYGLDMGGFVLLYIHFGVDALMANLAGKVLAGLFAFVAHRSITFGVAGPTGRGRQAVRYFTVLALNIPFSALLLSALLLMFPMAVVAKFLADVICVFLTYWLSKRFIFRNGGAPSAGVANGGSK